MSDITIAKLCSVCGIDCSTIKRAKDAQGHYICANCLERAREAKAAKAGKPIAAPGPVAKATSELIDVAKGTPDGVDPVLADLVSKSIASDMKPCGECGHPLPGNAVICTHCGYSTLTGKTLRTAVYKAPKEREFREASSRRLANPMVYYACSIVGGVVAGGIGAWLWAYMVESTGKEYRIGAMLLGVLTGTGAYVGARGFSNTMTGVYAALVAYAAILAGRYFGLSAIAGQLGIQIDGFFDVLPHLFTPWDIVWMLFAGFGAYKIGSSGFDASL